MGKKKVETSAQESALAKGNTSLLSPSEPAKQLLLPINHLFGNPENPRNKEDVESLMPLVQSIAEFGLLNPLIVFQRGKNEYVVICGNRRLQALHLMADAEVYQKLSEKQQEYVSYLVRNVSVVCYNSSPSLDQLVIVENSLRKPLDPIMESVFVYKNLLNEEGTQTERIEALATRMGQTSKWVQDCVRIAITVAKTPKIQEVHNQYPFSFEVLAAFTRLGQAEFEAVLERAEKEKGIKNLKELRSLVKFYEYKQLKKAPWLVFANGEYDDDFIGMPRSCKGCPFATQAQADLWGNESSVEQRCTNRSCYDAKTEIWMREAHVAVKMKFGGFGENDHKGLHQMTASWANKGNLLRVHDVVQDAEFIPNSSMVGIIANDDDYSLQKGTIIFFHFKSEDENSEQDSGQAKSFAEQSATTQEWMTERWQTNFILEPVLAKLVDVVNKETGFNDLSFIRGIKNPMIASLVLYDVRNELELNDAVLAMDDERPGKSWFISWLKKHTWERDVTELWEVINDKEHGHILDFVIEAYIRRVLHQILENSLCNLKKEGTFKLGVLLSSMRLTKDEFWQKYVLPIKEEVMLQALPSKPEGMPDPPENYLCLADEEGEEVEYED